MSNVIQRRHGRESLLKGNLYGTSEIYLVGTIINVTTKKLQELMTDRKPRCAAVHGVTKSWT